MSTQQCPLYFQIILYYSKRKSHFTNPHYTLKPQMYYPTLRWDFGIIITLVFSSLPTDMLVVGFFSEEGADAVCCLKEPELNVTYSVIKEEKRYALLSAESTELMALKATSWPLYHQAHDRPLSYLQLFNSMALEWRISTTKCQCVPLTIFGKA